MPELIVRDYQPGDARSVLAVNADNVPEVGPMDLEKLRRFEGEASRFPVVLDGSSLVGFAILLTEDADYPSPNFRWFVARHERFLYVDRIAISSTARGRGVGQRIYGAAVERAKAAGRPVLCAEVNTLPPNPASSRFHDRFGFAEVARMRPYDPDSEVAMLECSIQAD